jgi:hypothetical protein
MEPRPLLSWATLALVLAATTTAAAQPEPLPAQPDPQQQEAVPPPPLGDSTPADQVVPPPPADPVPPPPAAQPQVQAQVAVQLPPLGPQELQDMGLRLEVDPVLRLEGWVQRNGERAAIGRVALAILSMVMGAAAVTGAIWAYGLEDTGFGRQLLGATFVGMGAMQLAMGVAFLNITTPQEDRLTRWQEARRRGATALDVAGFEGEFRSEADMAAFQRTVAGILGLSMAAGGAAIVALTAADRELEDDELIVGYAIGGTFLITGALMGLLSLVIKAPIEQDWENYQRGATPQDPAGLGIFGG